MLHYIPLQLPLVMNTSSSPPLYASSSLLTYILERHKPLTGSRPYPLSHTNSLSLSPRLAPYPNLPRTSWRAVALQIRCSDHTYEQFSGCRGCGRHASLFLAFFSRFFGFFLAVEDVAGMPRLPELVDDYTQKHTDGVGVKKKTLTVYELCRICVCLCV